MMMSSPAAERNKNVILDILKPLCLQRNVKHVLEIASGTGEHCVHFARELPSVIWQPTDLSEEHVASIDKRILQHGADLVNVSTPRCLDVVDSDWNLDNDAASLDMVFSANMIHISPWICTQSLIKGASKYLKDTGILFTYGPYMEGGVITPQSNVNFDKSLKSRNPEWGLRDVDVIVKLAQENQLKFIKKIEVAANNKILLFTKDSRV